MRIKGALRCLSAIEDRATKRIPRSCNPWISRNHIAKRRRKSKRRWIGWRRLEVIAEAHVAVPEGNNGPIIRRQHIVDCKDVHRSRLKEGVRITRDTQEL